MNCPCHSKKPYQNCCQPFHNKQASPSPVELMRSRYSAYAIKDIDYILDTTHPDHPDFPKKERIEKFCEKTQFDGLEILSSEEEDELAYVTFYARLSQDGQDLSFTEKSIFAKKDGRWLYLKGEIL